MDKKLATQAFRNVERGQNKSLAEKLAAHPGLAQAENELGYSLLQVAVGEKNWDAFDLLIGHGADVNFVEKHNRSTPLKFAISNLDREGVERLLAAGADIAAGEPLLDVMRFDTNRAGVDKIEAFFFFMLEKGASPAATAGELLRLAAINGLERAASHLLDNFLPEYPDHYDDHDEDPPGLETGKPDFSGEEAAGIAGVLESLVGAFRAGAPAGEFDPAAERMQATRDNILSVLKGKRPRGEPALFMAIQYGRLNIVNLLLRHGGAAGGGGADGRNGLMRALGERRRDIAVALIEAGVSTDVGDYAAGGEPATDGTDPADAARAILAAEPALVGTDDPERLAAALAGELAPYPPELRRLVAAVQSLRRRFVEPVRRSAAPAGKELGFREKLKLIGEALPMLNFPLPETGEMAGERDAFVDRLLAEGRSAVAETRALAEVVADLRARMRNLDPRVAAFLRPGLDRPAQTSLWNGEDGPLPEAVARLYELADGSPAEAYEGIFRQYGFMDFAQALDMHEMRREFSEPYFFAFMKDVFGCTIELDTRDGTRSGLVYEVDEHDFVNVIVFPSPAAYFGAAAACLERGLLRVVPGGTSDGAKEPDRLVGDRELINRCFMEYALRIPGEEDGYGPPADMQDADDGDEGEYGESRYDFSLPLPEA